SWRTGKEFEFRYQFNPGSYLIREIVKPAIDGPSLFTHFKLNPTVPFKLLGAPVDTFREFNNFRSVHNQDVVKTLNLQSMPNAGVNLYFERGSGNFGKSC